MPGLFISPSPLYNLFMNLVKKAGFPLLLLSFGLFEFSGRFGAYADAVYKLALGLMVLGGLLLVFSPFLGGEKAREALPPLPVPPAPGAAAGPAAADEEPLDDFVPLEEAASPVPGWVFVLFALISFGGGLAWFNGPNGVSPYTVTTFSLMIGGILSIIGANFLYSGAPERRNILRSALTVFSFLLLFGGVMAGVLAAAGAFDEGTERPWLAAGAAALALGAWGVYYGLRYQQSREGLYIGRKLGFEDAAGGGPDGHYDSKGVMNGVEVLFDVTQNYPYKRSPASFRLEVLCRCHNRMGVSLLARPEGLLNVSFGPLPRVEGVACWDSCNVRCNQPDVAQRLLPPARKGPNVFGEEAGFSELRLEGGEFKFLFTKEGYIGPAYVRRVLREATQLAAQF